MSPTAGWGAVRAARRRQAKGVLMAARRCSEDAFQILAELSQTTNRTLRDVADALIASTEQAT